MQPQMTNFSSIVSERCLISLQRIRMTRWNEQDSGHGNQVTCKHHTETDGKDEGILDCIFALRI